MLAVPACLSKAMFSHHAEKVVPVTSGDHHLSKMIFDFCNNIGHNTGLEM